MRYANEKEYTLVLNKDNNEIKLEVSIKEALLLVTELTDYVEMLCDEFGEVVYAGKYYDLHMTEDARNFVKCFKYDIKDESAKEELTDVYEEPVKDEWDSAYLIKYRDITTMGWSNRTENCLKRANILFLGQLLQMTADDVIRIRNLGSRSLREIKDTLHSMGFALKDEELSFNAKVQICAARTNKSYHCSDCPLHVNCCDCFYNESDASKYAVDKACGTDISDYEIELED